jgi:uncharacterized protein
MSSSQLRPTDTTARAPGPDLARGIMLLLMALAHSYVFLYATDGHLSAADQATILLEQTLASERARPMFFILFGYGLGQLYLRQQARHQEWSSIRTLLRRRGRFMILIGALHVTLLFYDVVAAYGLVTVVCAAMVRAPDRRLLRLAAWSLPVTFALYLTIGASSAPLATAVPAENPVYALTTRLLGWAASLALIGFVLVPAMTLGIWAARRRILEEPARHQTLLTRAAVIGITLAVLGGLPKAAIDALLWPDPSTAVRAFTSSLHATTGFLGGIGAIALIALISTKVTADRNHIGTAIRSLGQRSLTFYLFQSVAFVSVFAPVAAGLGGRVSFAGAAAIALAVWLTSIALADVMRRAGHRGPAEIALRHLSYRTARGSLSP